MRVAIEVENNLKEILEFLEEKGYVWITDDKPTTGISWGSKYIIVEDKILTHRIFGTEPDSITLEQFKKSLIMRINKILPGYKLVLENNNTFLVMEYKGIKIVFPEGSNRSFMTLDELCDENLCPRNNMAQIVKVFNSVNVPIWERVFTRDNIQPGFTMINENGVKYLVVEKGCYLRIMNTEHFVVGPEVNDIMKEDMSPTDSSYATIVEIRNKEGKVVYTKK